MTKSVLTRQIAQVYIDRTPCALGILERDASVTMASVGWRAVPQEVQQEIINYLRGRSIDASERKWTSASGDWDIFVREYRWPAARTVPDNRELHKEEIRYAAFAVPLSRKGIEAITSEETRPVKHDPK